MQASLETKPHWLDRRLFFSPGISLETLLYTLIILLALFSRLYILGARVMSHDENSHVYYSWRFAQGQGFQHDPLMHGPIQFHLLALSYFMFGDNDFTGRLPQALCSIAAVAFLWFFRRYLGRTGALLGAVMMLISPYMMYYGRYARNEGFIELFGVVTIWAILRYIETGLPRYLYWLTLATVLHFTSKETSFIYTAQAMVFLALYFIYRIARVRWPHREFRNLFLLALVATLVLLTAMGGYLYFAGRAAGAPATPDATGAQPAPQVAASGPQPVLIALVALGAVGVLAMLYFLVRGLTIENLRRERSFSMLLLLATLVLPQLAAFPVRWMGWTVPTNASQVAALNLTDIWHIALFLVPLAALSIAIGMMWNPRQWWINAAIWYGVFTVFYTSLFTNGPGFFTGLIGSLGYWLEQQGVQRGGQPWYYYALVQVPVYEYLPALGTLLGFGYLIYDGLRRLFANEEAQSLTDEESEALGELPSERPTETFAAAEPGAAAISEAEYAASLSAEDERAFERRTTAPDYSAATAYTIAGDDLLPEAYPLPAAASAPAAGFPAPGVLEPVPVFPLLGFWTVSSLVAYSIAGEKMPWLTVHIALPAILSAGWAFGRLVDGTDWDLLRRRHGWLALVLLPVFLLSFFASMGSLLGANPPFQGTELIQLQATSQFLVSFLFTLITGGGLFYLISGWPAGQFARYLALGLFALLAVLTARTSVQANFYNYDDANELLVYAHAAPGVKTALSQIEEISRRTTDGLALRVAYDNETSYPYWWYLRNYPNAQYYGATPSRALREAPVILVGDANFGKIEAVVGNQYDRFDYIRLWWPNQDYFGLTRASILNAIRDPQMRSALFQIWLDRDYTAYGKVVGRDMSLPNWSPAARMRLYIRKDVTAQLWNYGSSPAPEVSTSDPFEQKQQTLTAGTILGGPGNAPGQFLRPRDIDVAQDGSLYVVDTENSRVQHLSPTGEALQVWGSFGDATAAAVPGGQFNQPWGIAVAPDGSVYVADTWNHRIQKFTAEGAFQTMWGYFGQGESPEAFWGPRDVAVDSKGRVYVTDTGNKRIVIFDGDGSYITQFGTGGLEAGQFDEPVGVAIDEDGLVYVADTWNQRIQVFQENAAGSFAPFRQWDVQAWFGQSLENKPFIDAGDGYVFAVDPEGYRVLQFTSTGEPVRAWGDFGSSPETFGQPGSVALAPDGGVWVVDTANSRIMYFALP